MTRFGSKEFGLVPGIAWIPWIALAFALLVFVTGYRADIRTESMLVEAERRLALDQIESSLNGELDRQTDLFSAVGAFVRSGEDATTPEIRAFLELVGAFERNPALQAVEWAPLVSADDASSFGDMLSIDPRNPSFLGAAERARTTGGLVATGPTEFAPDSTSAKAILLVGPVVNHLASEEEDGFLGVVVTILDVERLVSLASDDLPAFVLVDRGPISSPFAVDEGDTFPSSEAVVRSDSSQLFDVADRTWEVALGEGVVEPRSKLSMFVRLLPQLLTIFGVMFVLWILTRNNIVSQRRAQALTSEVQQKNRELVRSNEWLESFTSVASHDLRSPLRAVNSLVGFIREDNPDLDSSTEFNLSRIEDRVDRMNVLIDDLLTLARISDASERPIETRFETIIDDVLATVDIPEGFHVDTVLSGRESGALAPVQFRTCVQNLVDNAIKHHDHETGVVRIEVTTDQDAVVVGVSDDGPGIPRQYLETVFEPFRRLRPDDTSPGSGIGLTAIHRILDRNDGSIAVVSEEGIGTTFTLRWPLSKGGSS